MNINPSCDVDTYEDFNKYYNKSYLKLRGSNEIVFFFQSLSKNGVALFETYPKKSREGWQVWSWEEMSTALVFSRVNGKLALIDNLPYLCFLNKNRSTQRGFRPEHYTWARVQSPGEDMMFVDAPHLYLTDRMNVYQQVLTSKSESDWAHTFPALRSGVLIDDTHSVYRHDNSWAGIWWLDKNIGRWTQEDGIKLHEHTKWRAAALRHNPAFKGVSIQ